MTTPTRLIMLPGLAADAELFAPLRPLLPEIETPEWIPPRRGESLEAYAERFASSIDMTPPFAVGGFSFGGQVAMEMVTHLDPAPVAVVLLCGVRSREQFTNAFAVQEMLGRWLPNVLHRAAYGPFARQFARQERLDEAQTQLLVEMAKRNDPSFLKWSAQACARWRATPDVPSDIPIAHAHGEFDHVIPDVLGQATHTVEGARHLITLTHAEELAEWIREVLAR
ncbi:MAG: alpha/beta hydrolase [Planctomycetota bacterium]